MVIFNSYVKLPEGKTTIFPWFSYDFPIKPPFLGGDSIPWIPESPPRKKSPSGAKDSPSWRKFQLNGLRVLLVTNGGY